MRAYVCVHAYAPMYICNGICMCVNVYVCMYVCVYVCIYACICMYIYICICIYVFVYNMYMCVYVGVDIYIFIFSTSVTFWYYTNFALLFSIIPASWLPHVNKELIILLC